MNEEKKHENLVKHLEMIQAVINRMAANSFLLKGWTVTIMAGLFILSGKDSNNIYLLLAFIPITAFWWLDAFYLRQERLFRFLYDDLRVKNETDFSMDTRPYINNDRAKPSNVIFSSTLLTFYGVIILSLILVIIVLIKFK